MKTKKSIYSLSFLIPLVIVTAYFIFRGFAPFGSSSVLTVDLGQQYVDFYAFFKNALTSDPSSILYSFQKALGGNMIGTWSYYLMSPLNLLLLLFPVKALPSVIGIITILKYALAGLTCSIFLTSRFSDKSFSVVSFSTSYALMGWMVANQLNLLWIDAVILLPLIFLGLETLIANGKSKLFIGTMAVMLMINYYMAYMIALFSTIYVILYSIPLASNLVDYLKRIGRYVIHFLISALLSAWITIPTFMSLLNSKVAYSTNELKFKFEYNPLLMIGKFINGAFDFKQMPNGTPNLFVASLVIFTFLYFFVSKQFPKQDKIIGLIVTAFFVISMCFNPLDILWHAFQLPVWYSYRFSYIFSFWMIFIGFRAYQTIRTDRLREIPMAISSILIIVGLLYIFANIKKFEYMNSGTFIFGVVYVTATIALIVIANSNRSSKLIQIGMLILVGGEMSLNLVNSLNSISYLSASEYANFATITNDASKMLNKQDSSFFRVNETFQRSKNDALTGNYNGGSNFSSTLENNVSKFYGNIGNPNGDAFVVYTNPTLFTDALLGFKYSLSENPFASKAEQEIFKSITNLNTTRPELEAYSLIDRSKYLDVYENPAALPIIFKSELSNNPPKYRNADPLQYQNDLAKQLGVRGQLFTQVNPKNYVANNTNPINKVDNAILSKKSLLKPATISAKIHVKAHSSLYMELSEQAPLKDISITADGLAIHQFKPYKHPVVVNIANTSTQSKDVSITISTTKQNIWLSSMRFYQLNKPILLNWVNQVKSDAGNVKQHSSTQLTANFKSKNSKQIITSIPYEQGWSATIDGKPVKIHKWANTFIYLKNPKHGQKVAFTYRPQGMVLGVILTGITILGLIGGHFIFKRNRRY